MGDYRCPDCGSESIEQETAVILGDFGFQVRHWIEVIWNCLGCHTRFSAAPLHTPE